MHFDSLMPLSTTRASSMLFSSGGPGSKFGEATGTSSAFTVKTPSFGVSGNGSPSSDFYADEDLGFAEVDSCGAFSFLDYALFDFDFAGIK